MPSLKLLDKDKLLEFLGQDFNTQLSATTEPVTSAPRACDLLATVIGSGGEFVCMCSLFFFNFFVMFFLFLYLFFSSHRHINYCKRELRLAGAHGH